MLSILEFSYSPPGPPKSLLLFSLHRSDFVAGVPKGLKLYGLVRKLNHHWWRVTVGIISAVNSILSL